MKEGRCKVERCKPQNAQGASKLRAKTRAAYGSSDPVSRRKTRFMDRAQSSIAPREIERGKRRPKPIANSQGPFAVPFALRRLSLFSVAVQLQATAVKPHSSHMQ